MRENTNTYCPPEGAGGPTLRSITMEWVNIISLASDSSILGLFVSPGFAII